MSTTTRTSSSERAAATDARRVEARADRLVEQDPRIEEALARAGAGPAREKVPRNLGARRRLVVYAILFACLLSLWTLLRAGFLPGQEGLRAFVDLTVIPAALLCAGSLVEKFLVVRLRNPVSRYNLVRVVRLFAWVAALAVIVAFTFRQWYPLLVSLGVVSLVLGFALQTPITSFFGWIYILVKAPYRVGDRIRVGDALGDVIELGYLDTTLWEVRGPHLSTNHPSGRIIRFPNAIVLSQPVFNYSWPLFPYVWSEIKLQFAYESDLRFVAETMTEIAEADVGHEMTERVKVYRELLSRTPVTGLQISEHPSVVFRPNETWVEATLRFLVHPREMGATKTRLVLKILERLNAAPERVLFPRSNLR